MASRLYSQLTSVDTPSRKRYSSRATSCLESRIGIESPDKLIPCICLAIAATTARTSPRIEIPEHCPLFVPQVVIIVKIGYLLSNRFHFNFLRPLLKPSFTSNYLTQPMPQIRRWRMPAYLSLRRPSITTTTRDTWHKIDHTTGPNVPSRGKTMCFSLEISVRSPGLRVWVFLFTPKVLSMYDKVLETVRSGYAGR
jgi:hypothetical protein